MYKDNPLARKRRNDVRSIAESMVGGRPAYFKLTVDERSHIRDIATQLHDAGQTVGRAEEYEETNRNGFVYVIYHRRLAGIKIGRACNPASRLKGYQTGCPGREYKMSFATYFEDCYIAEAEIHARLNAHQLEGEWFSITPDEGQETIEAYARQLIHPLEK